MNMGSTRWAFSPAAIAALFTAVGLAWITLADLFFVEIFGVVASPFTVHAIIDLFFVLATSSLLYWLVRTKIRAVQESEARMLAIIENVPAAISAKDAEGRYILANREFIERNVLDGNDILGSTENDYLPSCQGCRDDWTAGDLLDAGGERTAFVVETTDHDGNPVFLSVSLFPIVDYEGNVQGSGRLCTDVTAATLVERALRESEARLRAIIDHSPASITLIDTDGNYQMVNSEFEKRHGVNRGKVLGRTAFDLFPEGVANQLLQAEERVLETGEPQTEDLRIEHADNTVHDHELTCFPVRDQDGYIAGIGAIAVDVTERKRIERELLESEAQFRASWNNAPILFNLKDTEKRYLFCNRIYLDWHATGQENVIGKRVGEIMPDELASVYDETDDEALNSGTVCERVVDLNYPDGKTRRVLSIKFPVYLESDELLGVGGFAIDITGRWRTEKALEESERLFRTFVDNSPMGFALKDRDGRFRMINRHYQRDLGVSNGEAIGKRDIDLRPRAKAERAREWDRRVMDARVPITYEVRDSESEGDPHIYLVTKFPVFDADGHVDGVGFCSLNITDREHTMSELRFAQSALENTQDALFWIDEEANFVGVNKAATRLTGYSRDELVRMKITDIDPDVSEEIIKALWDQIQTTKRCFAQSRFRKKDGTVFPVEVTSNLIDFEGKSYKFATVFDISDKVETDLRTRELQMELAHVSRLSTLGEMGAGFAHELNQPLAAIANFAGGALRRITSKKTDMDELEGIFERIAAQTRRAGEITNRIRKFVAKDPSDRTPSDINAAIREAVGLISNEALRHDVVVSTQLAGNLAPVMADPIQIQQLIINLAQNGIEAISEAGTKERQVRIHTRRRADGLLVEVTDSGPGISAEVQDRLFEPFFTTKSTGMGIGLQICNTIVENHDGRLCIKPADGGGTVASFLLPFADEATPMQ